jgi:bifunctional DNase/RNase
VKDEMNLGIFDPQFVFQNQDQEEETFHQKDLIQLFPYGVSFGTDPHRPFILLKDAQLEYTLPVPVHPLEAGLLINQSNKTAAPYSPHQVTLQLLKGLGIVVKQCVEVEIKGTHQFVRLYFSGHPALTSLKIKADEALSLSLFLNCPIFATKSFIGKSKLMSAQVEGLAQTAEILPQLQQKGVVH